MWENEPTGKGKDRYLFLFKDKLLLTKKKKPESKNDLPKYEFKEMIPVSP